MSATRKFANVLQLVTRQKTVLLPDDEFSATQELYHWLKQYSPKQQHRILRHVVERLEDEQEHRFEE